MMTSSSNVIEDVVQSHRLQKINARYFSFKWKSDSGESTSGKNNDNSRTTDNLKDGIKSNGFLKNMRKKLSIKNMYKSKRRITAVESSRGSEEDSGVSNDRPVSCTEERNITEISERIGASVEASEPSNSSDNQKRPTDNNPDRCSEEANSEESSAESNEKVASEVNLESDQNRAPKKSTGGLSNQLRLSKFGWYWGPISRDEADTKLTEEDDGAFLIRDSSDERYLLTLSFKSAGKILHSRIEHSDGKFSLCNNRNIGSYPAMIANETFPSIPELVQDSMGFSKHGVFCYSRPRYPGCPAFPVRLTKPVSRFTQVRSLQYLCRFVIRQNTRLDNIQKLPLPKKIKGYLEEAHY